ncbi:hypothetical protein AVDCRST_MAG84-1053 [uncultured Microcoleus sp.]|uniref:Uncharacterized protein n=1 Tax=uncultured Microcoleus sp. TaxID=259945 RepID=A0A6J4KVA9_9CYAN|nr:hypothetical protein AVDCRST_MAG84-1053 [uncultured Microcoleus sp.]
MTLRQSQIDNSLKESKYHISDKKSRVFGRKYKFFNLF